MPSGRADGGRAAELTPSVCVSCSAYVVDPVRAGSLLTLQGAGAYDAAVHCASVSAARRIMQQRASGESPTFASGGLRGGAGGFDMLSPATPRDPRAGGGSGGSGGGASGGPCGGPGGAGPSSGGGALMQPGSASPAEPSPGAASSTSEAGPGKRRLAGFGRKIRSALCDLLTIKQ